MQLCGFDLHYHLNALMPVYTHAHITHTHTPHIHAHAPHTQRYCLCTHTCTLSDTRHIDDKEEFTIINI